MIGTLLDKIGGLFEKDFLFASFLPALLFVSALIATLAVVIGLDAAWSWVGWLSTREQAFGSIAVGIGVIIFAYVLGSLRPVFARIWCGKSRNVVYRPFFALGERHWHARYRHLRLVAEAPGTWAKIDADFRNRVDAAIRAHKPHPPPAPPSVLKQLTCSAGDLAVFPTVKIAENLIDDFVAAQKEHTEDSLTSAFHAISQILNLAQARDAMVRKSARAALVNDFGPPEAIRATALGNLSEAFQFYPARRYNMEAEVYWPRLRKVVAKEYLDIVDEPRIMMDFSITMATLMAWYALLAAFVGPWLWMNWKPWSIAFVFGAAGSIFFYRRAVTAAKQYAQLNNACFDLFRLDLMTALHLPPPVTLQEERAGWDAMSQLIVFAATSQNDVRLSTPTKP